MTLPKNRDQREYEKFTEVSGEVAVNTNIVDGTPIDDSKSNPSKVFGYTDGKLTSITMTIGGVQYQKTLGYTGEDLTSISEWVEL